MKTTESNPLRLTFHVTCISEMMHSQPPEEAKLWVRTTLTGHHHDGELRIYGPRRWKVGDKVEFVENTAALAEMKGRGI